MDHQFMLGIPKSGVDIIERLWAKGFSSGIARGVHMHVGSSAPNPYAIAPRPLHV